MIHMDHICKRFHVPGGTMDALSDISIHVEKGDIYRIICFSGAEKSTLLRMVNRLEIPDSGCVAVQGQDLSLLSDGALRQLRQKTGMIFQQFNLLESKSVFHIHIDFTHRTFRCDSEATLKARVHCVIVAFSVLTLLQTKRIYINDRVTAC